MKKKVMNALENFSKAMLQPLMYLSVGGLILAIGALLTNSAISGALPFLKWAPIQILGNLMYQTIYVIVNNLAVLFVIGIPAAMAKKDKHHAGIIGLMSYLMYLTTSNVLLSTMGQLAEPNEMLGLVGTGQTEILGIQCVDMSVFGGIILGCLTAYVFNRTYNKRFNGAMQMFSGVRFSFLIMIFVSIAFGMVGNLVWPVVQSGISALANVISGSGAFGLFLYGFLERLLIPTGLHHLVYTPFQFSDLGGVLQLGDTTVAGAYAIAMTELNMPQVTQMSDSIYYMAIGFTKMFGYIGIVAAFIHTARPENKKRVRATLIPLVITSCIAGITEPIDFMFIFAAPVLFVLHAAIAGLFIALLKIFNVTAFCGGNIITSFLTNLAAGTEKTNWPMMIVLGVVNAALYFALFTLLIKKLHLHTPGREGDEDAVAVEAVSADSSTAAVAAPAASGSAAAASGDDAILDLIAGLGGKDNIMSVENCFTRLRVNVADESKVNEDLINHMKNSGIVRKGNDIQVIFGMEVASVRGKVEEALANM